MSDDNKPALAPGCYGSALCFKPAASECVACEFATGCQAEQAKRIEALSANLDPPEVKRLHKLVNAPAYVQPQEVEAGETLAVAPFPTTKVEDPAEKPKRNRKLETQAQKDQRNRQKVDKRLVAGSIRDRAEQEFLRQLVARVRANKDRTKEEATSRRKAFHEATCGDGKRDQFLTKIQGKARYYLCVWLLSLHHVNPTGSVKTAEVGRALKKNGHTASPQNVRDALKTIAKLEERGIWKPFQLQEGE